MAVPRPPPTMHPGEIVALTIVLRNDGTETWYGEDLSPSPVRLGAAAPRDRSSPFALQDPTWLWSNGKRVRMETPVVPSGALASFTLTFRAPESAPYPRAFQEKFAPVVEGGAWMDAKTITLTTSVVPASGAVQPIPAPPAVPSPAPTPSPSPPETPSPSPAPSVSPSPLPTPVYTPGYHWAIVAAQPAPATMHPGEKITLSLLLQNTGTETWLAEDFSSHPMRLAAVNAPGQQPRERASAFGREDPTWIWSGGRRVRMATPQVPSGALGAFAFTFTAPALPSYPQTFVERFAPIVEDIALLDDTVLSFVTQIRPAAGPVPPIAELPPLESPSPLPTLSMSPLPEPSPLPTLSMSPLPEPSPTSTPPTPGTRCQTSASPQAADMYPPAVAAGFANNGALLAGRVSSPQAVAYGFAKIFATDAGSDRVAKTDLAGFATEYFGATGSGPGEMKWPGGVAVTDSGLVLVADTGNDRIQVWGFGGVYLAAFGSRGDAPGQFRSPRGISIITNGPFAGNIAVADTGNNRIQILTRTGTPVAVIGSAGEGPGEFSAPTAAAVWGDNIFVADTGNERVQRLTAAGTFAGAWGGSGADGGCTSLPTGILVNAYGVFVVESGSGRVEHFTRWGALLETFGTLSAPVALTMDASSRLFVSEAGQGRVARFAPVASAAPPAPTSP